MTFGYKLRNLLEERNISQKQLATSLNIAPSTIGNYIQDTREPDFATLRQLAAFFGVTTDYLLAYTPSSISCDENEQELLRIFRSLTSEQQYLYLEQGRLFIKMNHQKEVTSSISTSTDAG